jgi:TPR repeat protein
MNCYGYHLIGKAQTQDERETHLDWIKRAAKGGESSASLYLGLMFMHGKEGFDADRSSAYEWFRLEAKYGNAKCLGAWGCELLNESADTAEEGKRLLMHAAMLGEVYAQSNLGLHQLWRVSLPTRSHQAYNG